jgi:hypothetical protein
MDFKEDFENLNRKSQAPIDLKSHISKSNKSQIANLKFQIMLKSKISNRLAVWAFEICVFLFGSCDLDPGILYFHKAIKIYKKVINALIF